MLGYQEVRVAANAACVYRIYDVVWRGARERAVFELRCPDLSNVLVSAHIQKQFDCKGHRRAIAN
jgi:hypothetical protein